MDMHTLRLRSRRGVRGVRQTIARLKNIHGLHTLNVTNSKKFIIADHMFYIQNSFLWLNFKRCMQMQAGRIGGK